MFAHVLDHFIFSARHLSERTKWISFGVVTFAVVSNFWWFRGMAFGIDGPINNYWGVGWRKVCSYFWLQFLATGLTNACRAGISIIDKDGAGTADCFLVLAVYHIRFANYILLPIVTRGRHAAGSFADHCNWYASIACRSHQAPSIPLQHDTKRRKRCYLAQVHRKLLPMGNEIFPLPRVLNVP